MKCQDFRLPNWSNQSGLSSSSEKISLFQVMMGFAEEIPNTSLKTFGLLAPGIDCSSRSQNIGLVGKFPVFMKSQKFCLDFNGLGFFPGFLWKWGFDSHAPSASPYTPHPALPKVSDPLANFIPSPSSPQFYEYLCLYKGKWPKFSLHSSIEGCYHCIWWQQEAQQSPCVLHVLFLWSSWGKRRSRGK